MFSLTNNWFDLLNTQIPIDKFTKSYGMNIESQNTLLEKMNNLVINMKVFGSKRILPFQTGNRPITNFNLI